MVAARLKHVEGLLTALTGGANQPVTYGPKGLASKVDQALQQFLLDYTLMTLKGTATVQPTGKQLTDGKWDGTLGNGGGIFKNFTGEWSASR